jgi:hypothetical protein
MHFHAIPDFQKPHAEKVRFSLSRLAALKMYKFHPSSASPSSSHHHLSCFEIPKSVLKAESCSGLFLARHHLLSQNLSQICHVQSHDSAFSKIKQAAVKCVPKIASRDPHVLFSESDDDVFMWVSKSQGIQWHDLYLPLFFEKKEFDTPTCARPKRTEDDDDDLFFEKDQYCWITCDKKAPEEVMGDLFFSKIRHRTRRCAVQNRI